MRYLCLTLLFVVTVSCEPQTAERPPRPVRAMEIKEEQVVQLHAFPGRTRAVGRVNLSFRVEGPLVERPVNVGDNVQKGDLLARIDPRDYEIAVQNAKGKLQQAEAQLRFAKRDSARAQSIQKEDPGAIAETTVDKKEEEVNQLKGEVLALDAAVKSAEDQLSYTYLRAPFEGMIVATYVENFEYVQAKQSVVRMLNTSRVEMVIDVPENLITEIRHVGKIEVSFDNYPGQTFSAKVKEIGTEASSTTRTYPVTLVMQQPKDVLLLSGMAGQAVLSGDVFSESGFLVPSGALFTDNEGEGNYLWIINTETQRVAKRSVKKGKTSPTGVLITSGVRPGEWVVTAGVHSLHENEEVKVIPVQLNAQGEQIPVKL